MYLTIAIALTAICGVLESCTALAAQALDALVAAYPEAVVSHDGERIIWRDGTIMTATDGIADKSFKGQELMKKMAGIFLTNSGCLIHADV